MVPYNVKIFTFSDLSKQVRVYDKLVSSPHIQHEREYVLNPFDGLRTKPVKDFDFVTFTFSSKMVDRYDYDACVKLLSKWLNNLKRSSPHLSYLVVPECHKDGAYHFHGLFAGVDERLIVWSGRYVVKRIRGSGRSRFVKTDRKIYQISKYRFGFMTAIEVYDQRGAAMYVTKYLTKELSSRIMYGRKRYWASRNLLLPEVETIDLDEWEKFQLLGELELDAKFKKICSVSYGDLEQCVSLFDVE